MLKEQKCILTGVGTQVYSQAASPAGSNTGQGATELEGMPPFCVVINVLMQQKLACCVQEEGFLVSDFFFFFLTNLEHSERSFEDTPSRNDL